jgi:1,5-anhydro-D-fructose reductase (1,5-anhydro-D-mannitol-forming)
VFLAFQGGGARGISHVGGLAAINALDLTIDAVVSMTGSTGSTSAGIEDTTMLLVRMKSGLLVEVAESFNTPHAHTGLEIHGTQGSIVAEDVLLQLGAGSVLSKWTAGAKPCRWNR